MPAYQPIDWYDTPLYYDIVYDADTQRECDFLEAAHLKHGRDAGSDQPRRTKYKAAVLEPACGSARLLAELARRRYAVAGFDLNAEMVRFSKKRLSRFGAQARVRRGKMQAFTVSKQYDFAFNLVSTFKYLLTEADAHAHLQCIAKALKPGGVYVLGFHLSDYCDLSKSHERWVGQRQGVTVTCNTQTWPPDCRTRTERMRSRLIVQKAGRTLRHETHWLFRTYDGKEFLRLLAKTTQLKHVATYDFTYDIDHPVQYDGEHLDTIVILKRC